MSTTPGDPEAEAARLRGVLNHLAETLYQVDGDPDVAFVKCQPGAVGAEITALADRLWPLYPPVHDALDEIDAAVKRHDEDAFSRLTGASAVTLPDGSTTGVEALIASLQSDADTVLARCHDFAGAARRAFAVLDGATTALADLGARTAGVAVAGIPEVEQARHLVDELAHRLSERPLSAPDTTEAEGAVRAAVAAVDQLETHHRTLADRLAGARDQLDELARLIPEGADALAQSRAKVRAPEGLLEPVDPAILDGGERGLRPWLARIAAEAAAGAWVTADAGLARWKEVADGWTGNARQVLDANRRPLERRHELRGLLGSYHAKAVATGRAEDAALAELHRAAHDLLWSAPCDLAAAELGIRHYVEAINAAHPAREVKDRP
jgi:hypothetical protein